MTYDQGVLIQIRGGGEDQSMLFECSCSMAFFVECMFLNSASNLVSKVWCRVAFYQ